MGTPVSLSDIVKGNPLSWPQQSNPQVYDNGNSGATPTIDFNNGNAQKITLNNNTPTITFANPVNGAYYVLQVIQDATGSRVPTWPGSVLGAPTLQTAPGAIDLLELFYDGTNYHAFSMGNGQIASPVNARAGIVAAGGFLANPRLVHTGNVCPMVATPGTDTTPVVTETYYAQVFIPCNMSVTGVAIYNGSLVAGNITVALANSSGVPVANSASTAASGTEAYQQVAFTAPYTAIGPATYLVLLQCNNTGYRFRSHLKGNFWSGKKTGETYGVLTTISPSAFTASLGPIASLY